MTSTRDHSYGDEWHSRTGTASMADTTFEPGLHLAQRFLRGLAARID